MTDDEILKAAQAEKRYQDRRVKAKTAEAMAKQRENLRNWRQEHPTYHADYLRKYRSTEEGKEVFRASNRRQRAKKQEFVRCAKMAPCQDCGGCFPPECMDFDHRDGETKFFGVAAGKLRFGLPTIAAEIAKCDLVCANCHRIRTEKRRLAKLNQAQPSLNNSPGGCTS